MSGWDKQEWIKDILAKSGSELTEIKEENGCYLNFFLILRI